MKKRLISLLLTLSMVFSMVPMLGIDVGAINASQLTAESAAELGKDVYLAWSSIYGENKDVDYYANEFVDDLILHYYYAAINGDISQLKQFDFVLSAASLDWGIFTANEEKELMYQTLLYDNLIASDALTEGSSVIIKDTTSNFIETLLDVGEMEGTLQDLLHFGKDVNISVLDQVYIKLIEAASNASDNNTKLKYLNLSTWFEKETLEDTFGLVGTVFGVCKSGQDYFDKIAAIEAIKNISKSNKKVVLHMYNLANSGEKVYTQTVSGGKYGVSIDKELKNAIFSVYNSWDDISDNGIIERIKALEVQSTIDEAEWLLKKGVQYSSSQILKPLSQKLLQTQSAQLEGVRKLLNSDSGFSKFLKGAGESIADVGAAFESAKFACDVFLNYSDKLGSLFKVESYAKIETLLHETINDLKQEFFFNPIEENAELLNAAYKMMLNFKYVAYQVVYDYFKCWDKDLFEGGVGATMEAKQEAIGNVLSAYESNASRQYQKILQQDLDSIYKIYTITYDAQKGTVSPSYSTFITGESVTLPTPERTGYDFLGWSKTRTAASGEYKGGQTCKFDPGNFILYAIWKPKSFNVIFDAAGGKFPNAGSSTITKTKEYNQAFVIDIEEPVKTNCTFAGKWVHVNGTTGEIETYDHDALKTIYSIGDSTLDAKILTAVWNTDNTDNIPDAAAPSYTIQYNANVPEGVTVKNLPAAQSKAAGAAIALSSAKPTRTGYTFLGWNPYSSETDANATYAPGELYAMDANLTLYAIWKQNTVAGTGIPGDINADKMVNNTDLIALRLYIDQKASKPLAVAEIGVDAEALDVNGNGKSAEEADFDTLMKYVSNWDIDIYYGTGEDINRYFTVTHSIQGDLLSAGTIEVWNGKATMTWNINSSHAWTAETTMTWCTFDEAGSKRSASGSAGQQELVIYLNDTQTSSSRTGNVKFTVDGEIYTITLKQQKAKLSVSHPDYPDVLTAQPIRLFNNSEAKMNLTVTSTHDWTVDVQNASSNWLTVKKTSDTNILITTNTYASTANDNTADIFISVNGDIYIIAVYQSAKPEPVTYLDAPTGVYVYALDHESISVSWNSVNNAENYEVYRSTSSSSGYDCVATVTETEYIDTGLNEDTRYYYKIKACAGDIKSDYSSYDYDTTDEGTPISFSATHPDHGELVDAGNIEVFNGKASMTWTINSSHDWEAETLMSWCYFDSTRTERETSGSAGKSTLKIYLNDSQTGSKRTGKVRFTVNGEIFTVTLMQKKAQIEISHPDYPDVIDDQPIHLFNNANISMNWTVDSTHDWSASVLESSSNWIKVQKTSDTNLKLTTLSYASASQVNTATIAIYVNGDVYEIEIYQD